MYIFKASGKTFDSVVRNQKHAFRNSPKDWYKGEIVLISKNKKDCRNGEKQIQYFMKLENIKETTDMEIEKYWPGNRPGRWRYIVSCSDKKRLKRPFSLEDILDKQKVVRYNHAVTFIKLDPSDEHLVLRYLENNEKLAGK